MKLKRIVILFVCLLMATASFAQQKDKLSREDKDEKNAARETRINKRNDFTLFRKQIMGLPEYAKEKRKIPTLQKEHKGAVKVLAIIDSNDNEDDAKTFVGYIRQDVGDNTTNIYEVLYDRTAKKIVSVKLTPEGADANKDEIEEKEENVKEKPSAPGKKAAPKKTKEDDDDDDPEDKPSKSKQKEKDDD
jgi:hypothetical protein